MNLNATLLTETSPELLPASVSACPRKTFPRSCLRLSSTSQKVLRTSSVTEPLFQVTPTMDEADIADPSDDSCDDTKCRSGKVTGEKPRSITLGDCWDKLRPTCEQHKRSVASKSQVLLLRCLTDKLGSIGSKSDLQSRFRAYQETLSVLVAHDFELSPLLFILQKGYEEVVSACFDWRVELDRARKELQSTQEQCRRARQEAAETVSKLKRETQRYMMKIAELTAACKAKDKQLKDFGSTQSRPSNLTEMVKTLQAQVQLLKTKETFLLSTVGQKQSHVLGRFKHKKSYSTMPRLNFFETQPAPGTVSPFFRDFDGLFWDGSTIEAPDKQGEDLTNPSGL